MITTIDWSSVYQWANTIAGVVVLGLCFAILHFIGAWLVSEVQLNKARTKFLKSEAKVNKARTALIKSEADFLDAQTDHLDLQTDDLAKKLKSVNPTNQN